MMAGQLTFPPLIHSLVADHGWRGAWIGLAIVVWVVLIPVAIVLVRRSPESIGLHADGVVITVGTALKADDAEGSEWSTGQAMRTRAFWLILVATSSQSLISTALVFHQVDVLGSRGFSAGFSAAVLSVMGPASFAGVLIAGLLADHYPNRYLLAVGQLFMMGAMALVIFLGEPWLAMLYGATLGFASGFTMTVSAVIWPNYFGRRHIGSIRGIATTMMVAAAALGPLPLALGFDLTGSYSTILGLALVLPAACGVMAYAARPPIRPRQGT
jgi:cyanate permease